MRRPLLEVACDGLEDALAAAREGADRVELCSALTLGGLTPSPGVLREADARLAVPFMVMVRPRPGSFVVTRAEREVMVRDAELALASGAAGIVFGALTARRAVDRSVVRRLVALATEARAETVFHRAFDLLRSPASALAALADLGLTRVLTAGGRGPAAGNAGRIARLLELAAGRIEILPGGGLRPAILAGFVARTGVRQVHFSYAPGRIRAARRALARRPLRPPSGGTR